MIIATCTVHRGVALVRSAVRLIMDPAWNLNQRHRTQSIISSELLHAYTNVLYSVPLPSIRYSNGNISALERSILPMIGQQVALFTAF